MVEYGLMFFSIMMIFIGNLMLIFKNFFAYLSRVKWYSYGGPLFIGQKSIDYFKESIKPMGVGLIVSGTVLLIFSLFI